MSESSDVRAAAERLARYIAGRAEVLELLGKMPPGLRLSIEDTAAVANAYLADHPSDDDEPVTAGWLEQVGFRLEQFRDTHRWKQVLHVQPHEFGVKPTTHWLTVHPPSEGGDGTVWWPINFWQQNEDDESPDGVALLSWIDHTTRGHVRRLCAALGVTLTERSDP